jgi:hypothetical protein
MFEKTCGAGSHRSGSLEPGSSSTLPLQRNHHILLSKSAAVDINLPVWSEYVNRRRCWYNIRHGYSTNAMAEGNLAERLK